MKNSKEKLLAAKIYWVYDKDLAEKYDPDAKFLTQHLATGMIDIVQFRSKKIDLNTYCKWVLRLREKVDFSNVLTFTNDYVECLAELKVDGVHIGANDMPVKEARELLGENVLIGATARTMQRAVSSNLDGADYLGVGTVFATTTKLGLVTQGPEFAKSVKDSVDIPVFAIGGINSRNVSDLVSQGINQVAVASNLLNSANSKDELKQLYKVLN